MTTKDTNPKDAVGIKKAPLSCVPLPVLLELGCAMLEGARKYGRHNYRAIGVRASVYFDAAIRHLFAWWEGETIDPDSGIPHVTKAMACLAVLRDAQLQGKCEDDRPPTCPTAWLTALNSQASEIVDRYSDPPPPHCASDHATPTSPCARELPHPMLCFEHGGIEVAGLVNQAFGLTCPKCEEVATEEDLE